MTKDGVVVQGTPRVEAVISDAWTMCGIHVVTADFARALEAEVAALSAQVAKSNEARKFSQDELGDWIERCKSLSAQVVELQKDAQRWKFCLSDPNLAGLRMFESTNPDTKATNVADYLNAAIDMDIDAAKIVNSSVTRASVPPSVKDSGT